MSDEAAIDRHNLRDAYRDVIDRIDGARESLEYVQGLLDDEPLRERDVSNELTPLVNRLGAIAGRLRAGLRAT